MIKFVSWLIAIVLALSLALTGLGVIIILLTVFMFRLLLSRESALPKRAIELNFDSLGIYWKIITVAYNSIYLFDYRAKRPRKEFSSMQSRRV